MSGPPKDRALWLGQHVLPYEAMMRAWLARKPRGGLEVDDIVQETYAILSALESVENIRNPRNYAFQTAYSVIQTHLRRARIISLRSLADIDAFGVTSDAPSPEREASDRDDLRSVEKYIAALPATCRDVIILRRVHELSHREIAARLNISENTVEKLISKAVRLLMEAFGRGGSRMRQASTEEGESTISKASES